MTDNTREDLIQLITRMLHDVQVIYDKFQLYIHLRERTKDRLEAMNLAPAFFHMTLDSLFNDSVVALTRMFELRNKHGYTILKVIGIAQSSTHLFDGKIIPSSVEEVRRKVMEKQALIDRLLVWRDKHYAHSDRDYYFDKEKLGAISPIEIRGLIEFAGEILNYFLGVLNNNSIHISATNSLDVDKVLNILNEHVSKQKEFLERWRNR
ncbi:hypothetical protein [Tumebacillus permanentifrigoris]|uniref:HEPN AbiU2-like domain-containing protein n=1 Tax=Tumebacillus permanentifrigoris TaxID=378543 RepID=A0A316DVG5_9BACL|nr:hypothetical protein [Tumebacillus permanentifrigoris]PWK13335.1 hypothetical protein C7459_1071 [Tumebacillus permanentifrigoris]